MNWKKEENALVTDITFKNFKEALNFVNEVGKLAEILDHHPDIFIYSYKNVKLLLTTHSAGEIGEKDYKLAEEIEKLLV